MKAIFYLFACFCLLLIIPQLKAGEGEEKTMEIKSFDGAILSGTLTLPRKGKPRGIVIMVHGSFVQTRDGDLDGSQTWMFPDGVPKRRLFLDMTNELLTLGWGTYRYDKRASGKSGGKYQETDMVILANDVVSTFNVIKSLYPKLTIGLIGQSEGALTVLKSWELGARPDCIHLQGPALEPFDITLEHQRTHGAAPFLAENLKGPLSEKYPYLAALYYALYFGDMIEKMRHSNEKYYMLNWNGYTYLTNLQKYREYLWDGREMLKKITVPVFVVIGSKDGNVRPEVVREIIDKQKAGEYRNVTVRIIEGLEHSFREVTDGDTFIQAMAKPISPQYISTLRTVYKAKKNFSRSCEKTF